MDIKVRDVLGRMMHGLGFASIFMLITLTILIYFDVDAPLEIIRKNLMGSMLIGIYFGVASFIFEIPQWSMLKQVVSHFSVSIIVFLPLALWAEWLPLDLKIIALGIVIFVVNYTIFWFCYSLYYRRQAEQLNKILNKK